MNRARLILPPEEAVNENNSGFVGTPMESLLG